MPVSLEKLWSVASALATRSGKEPSTALDECGLFLEIPPKRWEYFCTPKNSVTFANTGGDGVHFGLLNTSGGDHSQPVVMTVPMGDRHNVVVAEDLEEFLSLGYHVGWFSLEQMVYEPEEAVLYHEAPDPEAWPEHTNQLAFFRSALGLTPRPLSLARLAELEAKFHGLVIADDEPPDEQ